MRDGDEQYPNICLNAEAVKGGQPPCTIALQIFLSKYDTRKLVQIQFQMQTQVRRTLHETVGRLACRMVMIGEITRSLYS
jgi:hypothetical protein